MANKKISDLTNSLTKSTVATNDVLPIVDTGSTETKKITYQELIQPTDANFRIAGSSDSTKLVAFEVDGLTTATTRTLTVPDADLTLVGLATTQTLTNKTLTAPQINMGSDANGDLLYRNGSGATARLAIGTADQILAVQAGLPAWIANPSAAAASASAAGIVELATTAETETGTDATRAVTPDGLHDMTTLSGAAWFLDEDTMSSDSATKTASQQSIKAYVDNTLTSNYNDIPNTVASHATYFTWQMPILTLASTTTVGGWGLAGFATVSAGQGAGYQSINLSNNGGRIYTLLPGSTGGNTSFMFSAGKKWKAKFYAIVNNSTNVWGIGILENTTFTEIYDVNTDTSSSRMRLVFESSSIYLSNSNGTNYTSNTVSGITRTNWNLYELYFDGTSLYCYVNGTLKATNSTNLPTSSANECYFVIGGDTISTSMYITPITFSLEL